MIPRRELLFQLLEVMRLEDLLGRPAFNGHDQREATDIIDVAYSLAEREFLPCAALLDREEPRIEDGRVVMPEATSQALRAYGEASFGALAFSEQQGGLGLPFVLAQGCSAVFASANVSLLSYAMLTQGAARLIAEFGTEPQRRRYLVPMLAGQWFGTMCLSESHAGSSLADLRTAAQPRADGRYSIKGEKMWISGGEHELTENIVHLVLARIPGGPPGVKGVSLFIVPRRLVGSSGEITDDNGVGLIGLNHKMGWRGHVNTALSFGATGECIGELVGLEHHGLPYMFQMMNEARIAVGLCAASIACAGYRYSLDYARERRQGRAVGDRDPLAPQIPIILHADVRRMLIAQKALAEGALSLTLYCARLVDDIATATSDESRERLQLLLDLLTPIAKSWPAEFALEANKLAMQVLGGAGYTRDHPVERWYRDNRLNLIHEGTHGIHALDLLGRKVARQGGRALRVFAAKVEATVNQGLELGELEGECRALASGMRGLAMTTRRLVSSIDAGDPERGLANATLYLDAFGHIAVAWRWLAQACVARRVLLADRSAGDAERAYYEGKIATCRYFFRYELPTIAPKLTLLARLDDLTLRFRDEAF